MNFIVDRIEEQIAICEKEDLTMVEIPLHLLPKGVSEGSVVTKNDSGEFFLNKKEEEERRKRLFELQQSLFD